MNTASKDAKHTPWFSAKDQKPSRVGYYQTRCSAGFWKGSVFWGGYEWQIDKAETGGCSFGQKCDDWRGLTSRAAAIASTGSTT